MKVVVSHIGTYARKHITLSRKLRTYKNSSQEIITSREQEPTRNPEMEINHQVAGPITVTAIHDHATTEITATRYEHLNVNIRTQVNSFELNIQTENKHIQSLYLLSIQLIIY